MAFDGLVVHSLVRELQALVGGRIGKVHMPSANDIVLNLRAAGGGVKLLLSANPTYPRVHVTEQSFVNPLEAPMFCMLLRKHCEGGIVESITQPGLERIVVIRVRQRDELGDLSTKSIVIEIMGRHSNIILLDPASGQILDGIHHVTPAVSSHRVVLPGSAYVAPPEQHKRNPLETEREAFVKLLGEAAPEGAAAADWERAIVRHFSGISPLVAREIVYRAGIGQPVAAEAGGGADAAGRLWDSFRDIMEQIAQGNAEPNICEQPASGKSFFSVVRLSHLQGEPRSYASVSACLEAYYGDKAERDTVKQRASDMIRLLTNERVKNVKKLEKLRETLEEAGEADKYRVAGELLTASMHLFAKGDKEVEVIDYYDEQQRTVKLALDPLLTPSENAQKYFKKYAKLKNSLSVVKEQMSQAEAEIVYLDSVLQQLASAGMADIEEIRDELIEQGYMRSRGKKLRRKKTGGKPSLACYTSSEGIPIYVGKNNTQNEYLTNRLAHPGDTWLHTKDIPGSHVVIRSPEFGEPTLSEAAMLAAYFSQARESSRVPVDYTRIRHVRKPGGAKPGFVIYDHQKTLFVTPDPELIKRLPVSQK
ncbi:Rqc2 family fibronectin-binding protein [Paenibacillus ginsengihumi]|uniref:Rqc2 family fibronectin-binding protein n=1 Tax=Paenibacillus ginsengihumi TaxID=431596 RepID=UPI000379F76F|nr:NFACT RNA binding domain-containing protein [Paenibacillus ginsengihumi]